MSKTMSERFQAAAELLAGPGKWTQGDFAKNASGIGVNWRDSTATCFCLVGGIRRVTDRREDKLGSEKRIRTMDTLRTYGDPEASRGGLVEFNDDPTTTQDDVVTFLLLAAEAEK